jgi:hypothetical protein
MSAKPVIVIDFDDTLTAMPFLWQSFVVILKANDYRVICMTQRADDLTNIDEIEEWMNEHNISLPVYFTNGKSKTLELEQLGIEKYILCDDNPRRAVNGV